ncbi:MAG: DUF115 domain-containing protein [Treponema sp.]|jgi:hypothetical protein|nr:DUF115 domain-containing protein [Treponema sp.]
MRDLWELNRDCLKKNYPGLAEQLEYQDGNSGTDEWSGNPADIKIEKAASGVPAMIIRGRHVHSPRDPAREAERLAESLKDGQSLTPLVILGFGMGYGAEAAARLMPDRPLVIVERHPSVLRKALEKRDLRELLSTHKIIFIAGGNGEALPAALSLLEKDENSGVPGILKNRALTDLNPAWYSRVENLARTWSSRDKVNLATRTRFGKRWVRNLSRNMSAIRDLPGMAGFAGAAASPKGAIPVFLAAAGPSLDRAGPLLGEIAKRCIVVAVDTSLRFLLGKNAGPDFVLVVDPQFWNCRHLDRVLLPHTRLVAESAVYPPVLYGAAEKTAGKPTTPPQAGGFPFREAYLCASLFPLGRFIEDRVDPKGALGAGGSVATTAWDFARILGTEEIWIAGLDLSFPGLKTHYRGAAFEEKNLAEADRRSPAETGSVRALRDGFPFRTRSGDGGEVLTDRRLSLYAVWFENRFREHPGIRNYRLFSGGIAIEGLTEAEPEALLALPERRDEIEDRLESISRRILERFYDPRESAERAERYDKANKTLLEGLRRIKETAERGRKTAEKALKRPETADKTSILSEFDRIDREISQSEVKNVAGFLFPPEEEPEPGVSRDSFRRHLEYSLKLYRDLAETTAYTLSVLLR